MLTEAIPLPNTINLHPTAVVAQAVISVLHYAVLTLAVSVWVATSVPVVDAMNKRINKTYSLAVCALIAALSFVMLLLTGLIPVGTYALPCIAGAFLAVVVIEVGYPWAVTVYLVVSVLSFLFVSDKEAALYYAAFLGIYPVIKGLVERIRNKYIQYILKFLVFNLCVISAFYIGITVLSIPKESFNLFGVYLPWVFLLIGNVAFVIYDICLTRLITEYITRWRKKLKK